MIDRPRGTVTFLFTDIEGSTALWERDRVAMAAAVERHLTLLETAIAAHGGVRFKTVGDGVQSAFPTAPAAVAAALDAQHALLAEDWGEIGPLSVRMALHAGHAIPDDRGDYLASPLNRLSRLISVGYGGQILLTQTVQQLSRGGLPAGAELCDLGEHRLRDLLEPERIFQLLHPDVPAKFPPLKTLASRPNNLPRQPTPFLGRQREVAEVAEILRRDDVQLLTLTGPGGSGKSRLGLQAAADLLDDFPDGVFFVPLAALIDSGLVPSAIAAALGVREEGERSITERLQDFLADKQMLLLLDNFEHLLGATPQMAHLLASCPGLSMLATSRAPLHVRAERQYPVPPLALPDAGSAADLDTLARSEAVQLFVDRAQAARPDFSLTPENGPTVGELVRRLDGLPLAIELAAARVKLLPPAPLLLRLEQRLPLLTGGGNDAPTRQRTLRATIAWSHDLLSPGEQTLFRRLSVFVGGCTVAAVEAVVNPTGDLDVLEDLAALSDQSLLRPMEEAHGEPRVGMLETIREYAVERLIESGETAVVGEAHSAYFLALAEGAESELTGPDQLVWQNRLTAEHGNLRAALARSIESGAAETSLRLAAALVTFWRTRGHLSEGRNWLEQVLAFPAGDTPELRAKALHGAGWLASEQGEYPLAVHLLEESRATYLQIQDRTGEATATVRLGDTKHRQGALEQAAELLETGRALWRDSGDALGEAGALNALGNFAITQENLEGAVTAYTEALSRYRGAGDTRAIATVLGNLGFVTGRRGDLEGASRLTTESLTLFRTLGDAVGSAFALAGLGEIAAAQGDAARAAALFGEALSVAWAQGAQPIVVEQIDQLAELAVKAGRLEHASRLLGVGAALHDTLSIPVWPSDQTHYESVVAAARQALGEEAFVAAWDAGRRLPVEQAVSEALDLAGDLAGSIRND
jgi:predicted ATPase/class 3 adenylate cyclase